MSRSVRWLPFVAIPLVLRGLAGCVGDDPAASSSSGGTTDAAGGTDSASGGGDGGGGQNDSGIGDAGTDSALPPRCDKTKPFDAPVNVPNVNTGVFDNFVTLTGDETVMYLSSDRDAGYNIYKATRSGPTGTFSIPEPVTELNANGNDDRAPSVAPDDKRIYFRSNRSGSLGFNDIWTASRTDVAAVFGTSSQAAAINGPADDVDPALQATGERLFFASNRGGAGYRLYESAIVSGQTTAPNLLVNITGDVREPVISADALSLYYFKNGDIYRSTRATNTSGWPDGTAVDELNSVEEDSPGWLSPDECVMYLLSKRAVGQGSLDVWVAKRPPLQ